MKPGLLTVRFVLLRLYLAFQDGRTSDGRKHCQSSMQWQFVKIKILPIRGKFHYLFPDSTIGKQQLQPKI